MVVQEKAASQTLLQVLNQAHTIGQEMTRIARRRTGLRFEQISLLCALHQAGGPATIGALAASISRASHTVTVLVDRLEAQGFLARVRNAEGDHRQVWVCLTERGANAVSAFDEEIEAVIINCDLHSILPGLLIALRSTSVALHIAPKKHV